MSRTNKGNKGSGYEYWGRRPNKGTAPGPDTKRITHRMERQDGKQEATNNCTRCGYPMTEGACDRCEETPRCMGCGRVLIEYMRPPGDYCGDCLL